MAMKSLAPTQPYSKVDNHAISPVKPLNDKDFLA